ncbi:uncharacterized protein LOC118183114 isoform X2 [Stegodyphus dumicola]|uniref:uncharacterized protein LOC118183114 isoform X2 n=1 Tax=Stegodyphus dumicola TaxID=202533 RepID=UPI0015AB1932|nr:uncharacterized protein LOC118183114 isoform X2 [Stegodyphus dumicola]
MLYFAKFLTHRKPLPVMLQIAVCAEKWTKSVSSFIDKFMVSPLLFFTSFLEAAIYAKIPIIPHVCDLQEKKIVLTNIIENVCKAVVCTSYLDHAKEIHNFLQYENIRSYLVHEEMEHYISDEVIKDWKSVKSSSVPHCLILTDASLTKLCISDAECLIHYDVPEDSRLQFGNRFSCIAEHFTKTGKNSKCVCHILISEDCSVKASSLLKIVKRSGRIVPEELKDLIKKQNLIYTDASIPLCHTLKAFGFCDQVLCQMRHHIDLISDKPIAVPSEGDIQGLVTHVFDASHYCVRLLKYLTPDSEKAVLLSSVYAKIGFQLKKFYCNVSHQQKVENPIVGNCYVLTENSLYYRIKILDILPATKCQNEKKKVFFLDEGWVKYMGHTELYYLSDEIELPPPLALEVYLCNVKTPDSCLNWNPQANHFVSNLIEGKEIHGKIALCLGETLWIHPLVLREKLYFIDDYLNVLKLDEALKDAGCAKYNKEHLPLLYKICQDKVSLPRRVVKAVSQAELTDETQLKYAFLECSILEDVYVSSVISPDHFYVQRAKFVDCLDKMLDEINEQVKNKTLKKCLALHKGLHCIAPFNEDNRFYRALITDLVLDSDDVHLFFVDFGDTGCTTKDNIYVLPAEYLLLPFQAIECELGGICASHGGWSNQTIDTLYDLTRDEVGDMKILQLQAYTKSSCYDGGYHYVVDIWNGEKSLSKLLLEAGLVNAVEIPASCDLVSDDTTSNLQIDDIPGGFITSSDEERHPDDKDAAAIFCTVLSKLLLQGQNIHPEEDLGTLVDDISCSRDNHKKITATKEFLPEQMNKNETFIQKLSSAFNEYTLFQKEFSSTTNDKSYKPLITWWDSPEQLNIVINLRDIKVYELNIQDDGFTFETTLNGAHYYTKEIFYSSIYSQDAVTSILPQGINMVLRKQENSKWLRLTKDCTKFLHIKYDLNHLDDSDSEDDVPTSNAAVCDVSADMYNKSEIMPYPSDEDKSFDSSDDNYVQPWKKLAEYKDPYNPLS